MSVSSEDMTHLSLSADVTRPFPASRKIHVTGSRPDIRVPLREIALSPTRLADGHRHNEPLTVYDTSGPYTDGDFGIDLAAGLPPLRAAWLAERDDMQVVPPRPATDRLRGEDDASAARARMPTPRSARRGRAGCR